MIRQDQNALVLAPMEGITDAPMRALQGEWSAFSFAVSEYQRVAGQPIPEHVFEREVPELLTDSLTPSGLMVYVQILGGDPDRMAQSAVTACETGAKAIDINFGCPAPIVNRNDGGAALLQFPDRIFEVTKAVRDAVPADIPVSAKLRLGWDSTDAIYKNAEMAQKAGADWITVHARTKMQGYNPPVSWPHIGEVRRNASVPVVANGDIWNIDDFHQCQEETGCNHFMIGRGAIANPLLPVQIAKELGIYYGTTLPDHDWDSLLRTLMHYTVHFGQGTKNRMLMRMKQWVRIAERFGDFEGFDVVKRTESVDEFLAALRTISPALAHTDQEDSVLAQVR
jgi:tRNA-dihydrouridine synthase C